MPRRPRPHHPGPLWPCWLLALLLLPGLAAAMPYVPPSYTAEYQASKMGLSVVARITLSREGEYLRYRAQIRPTGVLSWVLSDEIIEQSIFRITPARLQSLEYLYQHMSDDRKRLTESRFDWERGEVRGTRNGRSFSLEIPPDAVDRFTLQLSMIQALVKGRDRFSRTIVDKDRLTTYHFQVGAAQRIDTPLGRLEAIPVIRHIEDRDTTVSTWFAPRLNYLPVRLEQMQGDERLVLNLRTLEWHDTGK
ncbi:DUF3108 domain-containing protein [Ectothiorhodospira mobilis]|uniref:DUF3108 domain-containing protein n=1 Tax=Ectothiorhodospira mobilis TaxID=195064 RepID=UPI001F5BF7F9|nr:DUF3108 domain-containing protein [Ectothiorhodospira mobilis]